MEQERIPIKLSNNELNEFIEQFEKRIHLFKIEMINYAKQKFGLSNEMVSIRNSVESSNEREVKSQRESNQQYAPIPSTKNTNSPSVSINQSQINNANNIQTNSIKLKEQQSNKYHSQKQRSIKKSDPEFTQNKSLSIVSKKQQNVPSENNNDSQGNSSINSTPKQSINQQQQQTNSMIKRSNAQNVDLLGLQRQQQQHSRFNNVKQSIIKNQRMLESQSISAFNDMVSLPSMINSINDIKIQKQHHSRQSQLFQSYRNQSLSEVKVQQVMNHNEKQQSKIQQQDQFTYYQSGKQIPIPLINQFNNSTVIENDPIKNQYQQNKKFAQMHRVSENGQKILKENNFWLKKKQSNQKSKIFIFDLRQLVRVFFLKKDLKKDKLQYKFQQRYKDKESSLIPKKIVQFITFYHQQKGLLKFDFDIQEIIFNCYPASQPYKSILNIDKIKWIGLKRICLQTRKRHYDSLDKDQFERFLKQANEQAQKNVNIANLAYYEDENDQDMKIQVDVNFLYPEMVEVLSKIKFNCKVIIKINFITQQTYDALKKMKSQSSFLIDIKFPKINDKRSMERNSQFKINLQKLHQNQYNQNEFGFSQMVNFKFDMQFMRIKCGELRDMHLQNYRQKQGTYYVFMQFQKELEYLYKFISNRHFELRIVHYIAYAGLIDMFQQWPQVHSILYYDNQPFRFDDVKSVFHITELTAQRLNKFPNLKSIFIDINQLQTKNKTKKSDQLTDYERKQMEDFGIKLDQQQNNMIEIQQSTLEKLYLLIKQFRNISFKFVDIKQKGPKFYLPQQNLNSFDKIKSYFRNYQYGMRIKIINSVNGNKK